MRTFVSTRPAYDSAVSNRASVWNLLLSLMAFLAFMVILITALGFGVGTVELVIWLAAVVVGVFLIVRRYRSARQERP
jgi:O-antigen/teichoic acid export membrane protein